uniref:Uncharacterized protein zf(Cchc)-19 n=1 Tax=Phallusia mammillata TaxID=59560 RepID=A0A6F9DXS3_9ASCI|nr:uncharacterized protein zf(cchc)-19 [Phallusia mammillata]
MSLQAATFHLSVGRLKYWPSSLPGRLDSSFIIYELLKKFNFPVQELEGIVERRGGLTDFTCRTKEGARTLQRKLGSHPNVEYEKLYDSEWTRVWVKEVPPRYSNEEIRAYIERKHGEVKKHEKVKDRWGLYDGKRTFDTKTVDLKESPIGPKIRLGGLAFVIEYDNQPPQCFVCRQFGHMRDECEALKSRENTPENSVEEAVEGPPLPSATSTPVRAEKNDGFQVVQGRRNRKKSGKANANPLKSSATETGTLVAQALEPLTTEANKELQHPEGGTSGAPDKEHQNPEGGTSGAWPIRPKTKIWNYPPGKRLLLSATPAA